MKFHLAANRRYCNCLSSAHADPPWAPDYASQSP